jgi:hypothetical protein
MTFQVAANVPRTNTEPSQRISPKGSPAERIWVIAEAPLGKDKDKGFLFSSPMGWSYDKLLGEAGIHRYYACYPDFNDNSALISELNHYCPPVVVCLDGSGKTLISQIKAKESLDKWAGSLLTSDKLTYPHYIIPTYGPETCVSDWTERQVVKYIDYGKVKSEYDFYQTHGNLNPLVARNLGIDLSYRDILEKLDRYNDPSLEYLSVDIETIYPREKSDFYGHPGYCVIMSIATSPYNAISFNIWMETNIETARIWKALGHLLGTKKIIGQNFDNFDAWHFEMLGMPVDRFKIYDTRLRHAVLWPELKHSLQFQTRQYTRQPYYKDEGHHWNPQDMQNWKRYNCLDTCVTYEVFLGQEEEFNARPNLR